MAAGLSSETFGSAGEVKRPFPNAGKVFDGQLPGDLGTELSVRLYALQCETLEAVTRGFSFDYLADLLCRRVEELASSVVCSVLLIVNDRLHPLAAPSLPRSFVEAIHGLPIGASIGSCGSCAYSGTEIDIPDIDADPRWTPYKAIPLASGLKACWSSPITSRDGNVIGTFAIYFRECRSPNHVERQIVAACLHLFTVIIEHQTAIETLVRTNRFLDATLDTMSQGLCLFDSAEMLTVVNRRFSSIYDLPSSMVHAGLDVAQVATLICSQPRLQRTAKACDQFWRDVPRLSGPMHLVDYLCNGRVIAVSALPVGDGSCLVTLEDVTERHEAEARIRYAALHDSLTGLPNRAAFQEVLATGLRQSCILLSVDLDRFKFVNDSYGHHAGDMLLIMAAERLLRCAPEHATVTRLGGDEFAVLLDGSRDIAAAESLARCIVVEMAKPFAIDGRMIEVAASIGIARAPGDAHTIEELLRFSDIALYRAKTNSPGSFCFYDSEMSRRIEQRRTLEADLRGALRRNEFELHFQPVISLQTDMIVGCEALLRWRHPSRGMVSPGVFIPIAEETGLIVEIGAWVLRTACEAAASWPEHVKLAVNLSAVQIGNGIITAVDDALTSSGLATSRLDLEVTETVVLNNNVEVKSVLHQLRERGVQISMDDFGTGYSSLSYLNRFPFSRIKIDRSFITNLEGGPEALAIVRAVIGLGKTLNMSTTAEGVETIGQLNILRSEGCDEVQGFLFSTPLPNDRLCEFLAQAAGQAVSYQYVL